MTDRPATPHLDAFASILRERYGFFKNVIAQGESTFGTPWAVDFDQALGTVFASPEALGDAAKGYAQFVLDLLRRQQRFLKERQYPAKTYAEAAAEVYHDADYMLREYLPGLLLSHYLWPHHYRQLRYFDSAFADAMEREGARDFAEVGIGTGLFSRHLLTRMPQLRGRGYDISESSVAFTRDHLERFGVLDRYELVIQDVVAKTMTATPWLVCVEVLEHLEDPVEFLVALRRGMADGGRGFITAALNAPHADHIYLYDDPEQVVDQLRTAGFFVDEYFVGPASAPAHPGEPVASVAAYVVH